MNEKPYKPILSIDFDGVIHSYTSGWKGADNIPDPPVPGAIEFLREAVKHFKVNIFSSRSHLPGGQQAMRTWLGQEILLDEPTVIMQDPPWFSEIEWPVNKPSAFLTIDDRALTFTGKFPTVDEIKAFKPWNKK